MRRKAGERRDHQKQSNSDSRFPEHPLDKCVLSSVCLDFWRRSDIPCFGRTSWFGGIILNHRFCSKTLWSGGDPPSRNMTRSLTSNEAIVQRNNHRDPLSVLAAASQLDSPQASARIRS